MINKNFSRKLVSILVICILIVAGIVVILPTSPIVSKVEGASVWTETSDIDFNNGISNNLTMSGSGSGANLKLTNGLWIQKNPSTKPSGRLDPHMTPIDGLDNVVLFGGFDTAYDDETWVYDISANSWTNKNPSTKPAARTVGGFASIDGTDKILLFGGNGQSSFLGDTWVYDLSANTWTNQNPSPKPSNRQSPNMASIDGTDQVLLYSGQTTSPTLPDDTWIYDLSANTWTNKNPSTKPGLGIANMATIYGDDKAVLFGDGKTWVYDLSANSWTNKNPSGNKPISRGYHTMVSIYNDDKIVLYGGYNGTVKFNDTWIYDLSTNTWTEQVLPIVPTAPYRHGLSHNFANDKITLFGGLIPGKALDETWIYSKSDYRPIGSYVSQKKYLNSNFTYKKISWSASTPSGTSTKFQIRSANNESDLAISSFVGPGGLSTNFYTNSGGESIWSGHKGDKWIQYKANLATSNVANTPTLNDVTITYNLIPNSSLVAPINLSAISNNTPIFVWNISDIDSTGQSGFQVLIDNDINFNSVDYDSGEQSSISNQWQFPIGTSYTEISDGKWYWKIKVNDTDGDWSEFTLPWELIVDTKAPNSSIVNPLNNQFYKNMNSISGITFDGVNGSGANKVEITIKRLSDGYYWNGSDWDLLETWLITNGAADWSYVASTIIWTSGVQYNVKSRATDKANNSEIPSTGNTFTIDKEKPTSTINIPINNSYLNNLDKISGNANDIDNSGINHVEVSIIRIKDNRRWDGTDWNIGNTWLLANGTNSWSFNSTFVMWSTDTEYKILSRGTDNAGNIEIPVLGTNFIYDDHPPKDLSISINNDNEFTKFTSVTLSIYTQDTGSGLNTMSFSTDSINWTTWESYNTTKSFNLLSGDGEKFIFIKVKDNANNYAIANDSIILDTTPPHSLLVEINNNELYTNSKTVELKIVVKDSLSGIDKIAFSDNGINWTDWELIKLTSSISNTLNYEEIRLYNLTDGDDSKTVFIKVQDNAGNIAGPVSDNIVLDTKSPEDLQCIINEDDIYTNSNLVELSLYAVDSLSGLSEMSFSQNLYNWSAWEPYNQVKTINLTSREGEKVIYFRIKDKAGNLAITNDTIKLDSAPPYSLSITINNGASETKSTSVVLQFKAFDNTSGVSEMSFSIDGNSWDSWELFNQTKSYILLPDDGKKTVYFRVRDHAGNIANPVFASILLDTSIIGIDSDNDNILDEWEISHGLNKSDPTDAKADWDNDGLINLEEYQNNTNITNPDSDNDGLNDTEELRKYGTEPLIPDSDNDGYSDGEEIEKDTNPLDDTDYPGRKGGDDTDKNDYTLFIMIIIIIIIILLLLLLLTRRKRSREELEEEESEEIEDEYEEDEEEEFDETEESVVNEEIEDLELPVEEELPAEIEPEEEIDLDLFDDTELAAKRKVRNLRKGNHLKKI
jgi:hypothetical protein